MIEILVLILGIVGVILFNENRTRLKKAENDIFLLKGRIDQLARTGIAVPADVPATSAADAQSDGSVTEAPAEPMAAVTEDTVSEPSPGPEIAAMSPEAADAAEPAPAMAAAAAPAKPAQSLESRLGAQWTVWVGGIALALGGVFFVRYSIEQGLLSPAVRIVLGFLFGLGLLAAGEIVRRRTPSEELDTFRSAMIPGVLTAAGSLTLFGVIFAAHNFYGFFGPTTAFLLFAVVSVATIALSLRHGQAMAGLGLLAAMTTPLLVASTSPRPWGLFGFLALTYLATLAAARIRRWRIVPAMASVGLGLWALLYMAEVMVFEPLPVLFAMLVMIAAQAFLWPAAEQRDDEAGVTTSPVKLLFHSQAGALAAGAVMASLVAAVMVSPDLTPMGAAHWWFAVVIVALLAHGAFRPTAGWQLIMAGLGAILGFFGLLLSVTSSTIVPADGTIPALLDPGTIIRIGQGLGLAFVAMTAVIAWRHVAGRPALAVLASLVGVLSPLALAGLSFGFLGNYEIDWTHGLFCLLLGVLYGGLADWTARSEGETRLRASDVLLAGHFASMVAAIFVLTDGLWTTILVPILGMIWLLLASRRPIRLLPWLMVASSVVVALRIAWDPTIVGPSALSTTPVFNQLLAGYGVPAALLVAAAWLMRNHQSLRLTNALQALASLFVLMTAAIEIRHLMQGGKLDGALPTLAEQSVYTLLAIGASAVMMALDLRRGSPVFRYGSMGVAVISILMVLVVHLFALNPYFSGELTGSIPVFNLLLIGYLLPALGYAGLAWLARDRRPLAFVRLVALSAALMAFLYATLSVRRIWQGESLADWKGFLQGETYTYSVVWLVMGVALLVLGYRFKAQSIRIASAVLVLAAVLKVFLVDMSNLEGLWRAASFIGLGLVLIGIGRFYQHILVGDRTARGQPEAPDGQAGPAGPAEPAAAQGQG